jgi:2-amino-4-hydroxy-6-hydroxymethyldihydropteridine diphosphokinase
MSETAYIGLGSNLASPAGTPAQIVRAAMNALGQLGDLLARSSLYETHPVGFTDQPTFINAAVALRTTLAPEALLEALLNIERSFGRDRETSIHKGPRILDLDLLLMGDSICSSQTLTLPHPALAERRFVLAPLAEIAPELRHPALYETMEQLLRELPDIGANRIDSVQIFSSQ